MGISILVPDVNWASRNLGKVTPTGNVPIQAIAILGDNAVLNMAQYDVNLFPVFTTQRNIVWSIVSGSQYADIDQTGKVTTKPGASSSPVTIRATSANNAEIWAEKNISVTTGTIVYYDWLESDGNSYIVIPGLYLIGGRIVSRVTYTTANGYIWGGMYQQGAGATKVGTYKQTAGPIGVVAGAQNYLGTSINPESGKIYRYDLTFSTTQGGTDAKLLLYDDSADTLLWSRTSNTNIYLNSDITLFCYSHNSGGAGTVLTPSNFSANKLYGFEMYNNIGEKIYDLKPVTFDGVPAVLDEISKRVFANSGEGTLTVGND